MIEEGIIALLLADTDVAALVSTRVYGVKLPQDPTLPAVVMARISESPEYATGGMVGLSAGRFQIDCWAAGLAGSRNLKEAVRKLLSGYKGTIGAEAIRGSFQETSTDLYDSELDAHRVSMDFLIWHVEPTS